MEKTAKSFFDACEAGEGWEKTSKYVHSEVSPFDIQVTNALPGPKASEAETIKDYVEWMAGVVKAIGPEKSTVEVKCEAFDKERNIMMIYAVFGGVSDYVQCE